MYPDLSYILHALIGTEPDNWTSIFKTFGLLLVIAILTAALFLYMELKRKANEGVFKPDKVKYIIGEQPKLWDVAANGLFGLVLGLKGVYIAQNFTKFQNDPAELLLSLEGNWLAGIGLAAVFAGFRYWEQKKAALPKPETTIQDIYPHDRIGDVTMVAAVSGILGAKFFAIFEAPETMSGFFSDPIGTFFSGSGLAIYGGLIGGFLGVWWWLRKHRIAFWPFADAIAPALMISYGVGRIGCQLSGDGDWGIAAGAMPEWWMLPDWLWSFEYPQNVNNAGVLMDICDPEKYKEVVNLRSPELRCEAACGTRYCHQLAQGVYPTPHYEIAMSFLITGILWALRKRLAIPGMLFFIYLIFNGIERFLIEKIRVNDILFHLGDRGVTQAELISTILFFIGVFGVFWLKKKHKVVES